MAIDEDERQLAINARNQFSGLDYSDHLMLIRLIFAFEAERNEWIQGKFCETNFVSQPAMIMIRGIKLLYFYLIK